VPTVGQFKGIKVRIYAEDHGEPHVHVKYQKHTAKIEIETLELKGGGLEPKQLKQVRKWIQDHRLELLLKWEALVLSAFEPITKE